MKNKYGLLTRLFALTIFASISMQAVFSQTLTVGEVHSYKVGDEFAIRTAAATGPDETSIEKITGRTDFGTDSVQFTKQVKTRYFDNTSKTYKTYQSIQKYTVKGLNNPFFTLFRQKDTLIVKKDSNDQLISRYRLNDLDYKDDCQTIVNERMDSSWTKFSGEVLSKVKAYKGLGVLMYYYDKQGSLYVSLLDQSFIYYKANGIACGDTTFNFNSGLNSLQHENTLKLWPNPVKDVLFNSATEAFEYRIYDSKGQLVLEGTSIPSDGISVSGLPTGMYYLSMDSLNRKQRSIFLKE
jgi:hypothetical protein